MTSAQIIIVVTIVLYLAAMVFVGVYFGKKGSGSSSDDFYLGGRKMGPIVTAMSAEASDMSSYLLMGLPGLAYLCGLPEVTWTAIGLAIGTYLNWLIVARRLRRYSAKLGAITIPDFFARRYGDKKHLLSCIAAVVILIFFIPYTASGFKAIGTLFNSLFGVEYHTAMIVGGIVVVLYTVMGGFMAVSFTDLIQSIFMTIALIVIVCFGVQTGHGHRQRQRAAGLSQHDAGLRRRDRHGLDVQRSEHRLHARMGPRLLWHAAHPAALYGHPRGKGAQPVPPHRDDLGCHLNVHRRVHRRHRLQRVRRGQGAFPDDERGV